MGDTVQFAYLIEPPFNFRDLRGQLTGSDVQLARLALEATGRKVQFVEAAFADLLPGLSSGRWNMTTGLFATKERAAMATFSRPIWALPDGLLVAKNRDSDITGYLSAARRDGFRMAVIQGQVQEDAVRQAGFADERLVICGTYQAAAEAVLSGDADGYASVARAHVGYLAQNPDLPLDVVTVSAAEKAPALGCFGFPLGDDGLRQDIDDFLLRYIGSAPHRAMMHSFGFVDAEIDIVLA
jgi:polar amino acid transport system substrate-binding protein